MPKKIHMTGIGGIGMSALAQYYISQGTAVSGSDREASPVTAMLEGMGISVFIGTSHVPEGTELLVYSDAVPEENEERMEARKRGVKELSYFEALGEAATGKRIVAISGTHGKTTTTAMIGKILIDAHKDPTVIVGSIVSEWKSNFHQGKSDLFIVEACEYRNHFLVFHPEVLVITNMEWDHTDFFKNVEELQAAFDESRAQAKVVIEKAQYEKEEVPPLLLPGEFNRDNAKAAKAAVKALGLGISDAQIDTSLSQFKGTWRRFEYKGVLPSGAALYDDYAHHPTAIEKTLEAAREKFPGKKLAVFFHPHLYSRTRDLWPDFVRALSKADDVYILPVYAAREAYDASVSHEALAEAVGGRAVSGLAQTTELLKTLPSDTIAFTMGAGDVYKGGEAALRPAQGKHSHV